MVRPLDSWAGARGGYVAMAGAPRRSPSRVLMDTPSARDRAMQRGHRRLAFARLEPGQVGGGQLGALGQLLERQAGPGALLTQALGDGEQGLLELHRPIVGRTCLRGK